MATKSSTKNGRKSGPAPIKPQGWKLWMGLVLSLYGAYAVWTYWSFELVAIHTDAVVESVRNERLSGRRGSVAVYRPVVTFTPPGATYPVTSETTSAASTYNHAKGTKVRVEFLKENPSATVRLDSGISWLDESLAVIGLALLGSYINEVLKVRKHRLSQA